jgi:HD-like signal output (HDOD) protein
MNAATSELLQRKVGELHNLPAMPAVLRSLSECLSQDASAVSIEKVVDLISYDKSLAGQCLRMANSALFQRQKNVASIRDAVVALGIRNIRDLVYSVSLPKLFAGAGHGMAPVTFWRHALGTALISQHFAYRLGIKPQEKFYLAGLLHDIGILVNALLFPKECGEILETAKATETPLCEVEQQVLGFTHCESGRILAGIWNLPPDVSDVIEYHHQPPGDGEHAEVIAVVYLADLLCRLRGLGYGYYEARQFDLSSEPAWQLLAAKYPAAHRLDIARFTFELDGFAIEVEALVDSIFSTEHAK